MPVYNDISSKSMQFDLLNTGVWKVIGLTIVVLVAVYGVAAVALVRLLRRAERPAQPARVQEPARARASARNCSGVKFLFWVRLMMSRRPRLAS